MVLDDLNAWLKPHGLWFPVDVLSTSAQCTIGGMTGNNSCGSRSIAYGNMVHNVLAIDAVLADGSECHFGSLAQPVAPGRVEQILRGLEHIAKRERAEIVERIPKVLRRVGGYNIDLFDCQEPAGVHRRRLRKPVAYPGRLRGDTGLEPPDHPETRAVTRTQGPRDSEFPDLLPGDGHGTAHCEAAPDGGRAGWTVP